MTTSIGRVSKAAFARPAIHPFQGQTIENTILQSLPRKEREMVCSKLEFVEFPTYCVLNQIAEPIEYGYFINSGLASILNVMLHGKSVEVGLTGKEGFVGLPLLVGFRTSPTRAVTQIAGTCFRIRADDLKRILPRCPRLLKLLHRFSQEFALQVTQVAACNQLHRVDQKLARWFLMSQDRMGGSSFVLTQELLSQMLGTRRASVTIAAGILQKKGLITYKRGRVKIEKRAELEKAACDCYRLLTRLLRKWKSELT